MAISLPVLDPLSEDEDEPGGDDADELELAPELELEPASEPLDDDADELDPEDADTVFEPSAVCDVARSASSTSSSASPSLAFFPCPSSPSFSSPFCPLSPELIHGLSLTPLLTVACSDRYETRVLAVITEVDVELFVKLDGPAFS